ncbi:MAG: DUF3108 domain-containing protein [Deltaproteobacteria bacterium]|nr:DUF3108 domain-containing protein [Deltaproteobacteria bacterium]
MKLLKKLIWFGVVFCIAAVVWGQTETIHIQNGETHTVRVTKEDGATYTGVTSYKVAQTSHGQTLSYIYRDKTAQWQVTANAKGHPSHVSYRSRNGQMRFDFDGIGNVTASGTWNQKPIRKKTRFSPNVTAENMLILSALPLEDDTVYEFDLLQMDALPKLKAYPMSFQLEGHETVTVKAGTFRCHKVRFTFSDWRRFFWKAFYYVTDDKRHMVVKIENIPDGGSTELVNVE